MRVKSKRLIFRFFGPNPDLQLNSCVTTDKSPPFSGLWFPLADTDIEG